MIPIDADTLLALAPGMSGRRAVRQGEIIQGMGSEIASVLDSYGINTPLRVGHFLAQVAHESDAFCTTEEYASGRAYEHRRDLGNDRDGDGPLFKGRGLIQLTGRANYRSVGRTLDLDLEGQPLSVNDPHVYLLVSCVYWAGRGINELCDQDDIRAVTHAVNGGYNGLDSRIAYYGAARKLIAGLIAGAADHPGGGLSILHLGSEGDAVAILQHDLRRAGYPVGLDGTFGPATELAVKHFQSAKGIAADGVVGAGTWQALGTPALGTPASGAPALATA